MLAAEGQECHISGQPLQSKTFCNKSVRICVHKLIILAKLHLVSTIGKYAVYTSPARWKLQLDVAENGSMVHKESLNVYVCVVQYEG